jgi:RimJ/RimL family protein N-acetyltransferase
MEDLKSLVKYANNKQIADNMRNIFKHPYTEADGLAFLNMSTTDNPHKRLAIEVEGEAVGSSGIFQLEDIYEKNAEIGYWLGEPFWGKGIMTEVVKQMVTYGFNNWPVNRIFACVFEHNLASERVLIKAGFKQEAYLTQSIFKNGVYLDEKIYAIHRK